MKIFQRRRLQIGLSTSQVAKLSGIDERDIVRYENESAQHRILFDHAVILARVLGVQPRDMPGLRTRDAKDSARTHVADLVRTLLGGPILTFEGRQGERFGGDLDRVATMPAFGVRIGDGSLGEAWVKGSLLGFVSEPAQNGDVVLLRHRRSKLLALRRLTPPSYSGLSPWQPSYVVGGEWLSVGRLQVILPRTP
jgi:hypothetical protein